MTSDERQMEEVRDERLDVEEESSADSAGATADETSGSEGGGSREELDQLQDRYLRLAAEFDNYRKRTERERLGSRDRVQGEVVEALLEPLDDLSRVADYEVDKTTVESLLEGVQMVERKLLRVLTGLGLEPLDAKGKPFDPELHEALMTAPTDDGAQDDTVGEVFQSGYRFRGALIRPARVQVLKHDG